MEVELLQGTKTRFRVVLESLAVSKLLLISVVIIIFLLREFLQS
jgi:hypothetical protein